MMGQFRIGHDLAGLGIDRGYSAAAIPDQHVVRPGIDTDIVGVVIERDLPMRRKIRALIEIDGAGIPRRDVQRIGRGDIAETLRLLLVLQVPDQLSHLEVDDADSVVAELGDEKALAPEVDREMIDPARDRPKRNLALQNQRRICGRRKGRAREDAQADRQNQKRLHGHTLEPPSKRR